MYPIGAHAWVKSHQQKRAVKAAVAAPTVVNINTRGTYMRPFSTFAPQPNELLFRCGHGRNRRHYSLRYNSRPQHDIRTSPIPQTYSVLPRSINWAGSMCYMDLRRPRSVRLLLPYAQRSRDGYGWRGSGASGGDKCGGETTWRYGCV